MLYTQYNKLKEMKKNEQDLKDLFKVPQNLAISSKKELLKLQHMRPESVKQLNNTLSLDLNNNKKDKANIVQAVVYTFNKM